MASHVPFLAVRPDDQFSTDVKTRDFTADTNAVAAPIAAMDAPPRLTTAPRTYAASRLPAFVRFPLVVILSFSLSSLFHSLTADFAGYQLATASRDLPEDWQVASLMGWKLTELLTAWYAGYDYEDLAALTLLTSQPYYFLLYSFWSIEFLPVLISLAIDVVVIAIPFALLRPLTHAHDPNIAKTNNQAVAIDWQVLGLTSLFAASVYAVTFYISYQADLGVFLINHFDDIPSLEKIHETSVPQLTQWCIAAGAAAMVFLFRPTVAAAGRASLTEPKLKAKRFSPETATLGETFAYNLGYGETGWSHRAEVLAKRTAVLTFCTMANTFVRVYGTVRGTDVGGTLGYAGLWAIANVLVALAYAWLGQEK